MLHCSSARLQVWNPYSAAPWLISLWQIKQDFEQLEEMKLLHRISLLGVLILGVLLLAYGVALWMRADYGPVIRNWINPQSRIPGRGYMWTWGVNGNARSEPDEWHFHVILAADNVANITLLWKLGERVLYHRTSAHLDETFVVALPRASGSWRWDWLVGNPSDSTLTVDNFTVIHYSIEHPERQNGSLFLGSGVIALLSIPIAIVYGRHQDTELKPPN